MYTRWSHLFFMPVENNLSYSARRRYLVSAQPPTSGQIRPSSSAWSARSATSALYKTFMLANVVSAATSPFRGDGGKTVRAERPGSWRAASWQGGLPKCLLNPRKLMVCSPKARRCFLGHLRELGIVGTWQRLARPQFGLADRISEAVSLIEWRDGRPFTNVRNSRELLIACDFSGSHEIGRASWRARV